MKVISIKKENILFVLYVFILGIIVIRSVRNETVPAFSMPVAKKVILIDAGHGGWESGISS